MKSTAVIIGCMGSGYFSQHIDLTCAQKANIKNERNTILEDAILIIAFRTIILVPFPNYEQLFTSAQNGFHKIL